MRSADPVPAASDSDAMRDAVLARLAGRSVALVGLMGAGKTTIGRRLAQILSLPFCDTDSEIEAASQMSIPELFETYGEPEFRTLEARVITRLAESGQMVVSTGGGAYINDATRAILSQRTASVWLKADLSILMERVARRSNRPLLKASDPERVMRDLMAIRYPVYALADVTVQSRNVRREVIAREIIDELLKLDFRRLGNASDG